MHFLCEKTGVCIMMMINIDKLVAHKRNKEFFDDMTGEKWELFRNNIKERGVIEPIVITTDKVIVSGHQRVRAVRELGMTEIPCVVVNYDNEDEVLEDLICTNIMQRGAIIDNPVKTAKAFIELERIRKITHGGVRKKKASGNNANEVASGNNVNKPSQEQLAEQLNMSERQLRNYKALMKLIPELQDLVETKQLSASTGYMILSKLPKEEQQELLDRLGREQITSMTRTQLGDYIKEEKRLRDKISSLERLVETQDNIIERYRQEENKQADDREIIDLDEYINMLNEFVVKLSPLPHIRGMRTMAHIDTARETVLNVVDKIEELCDRIEKCIHTEEYIDVEI